jgi:hypothetical protein
LVPLDCLVMNRNEERETGDFQPPKFRQLRRGSLVNQSEDFDCLSCRVNDTFDKEVGLFEQVEQAPDISENSESTIEVKQKIQNELRRMSIDGEFTQELTLNITMGQVKPLLPNDITESVQIIQAVDDDRNKNGNKENFGKN